MTNPPCTCSGLTVEINSTQKGDSVPEWIKIIPRGPKFNGRDGKRYFSDAKKIIHAFQAAQKPIVIDWEHKSELKRAERAEAAGWIEELKIQDDEVWGKVIWTPQGRTDVANRVYRFISPTFIVVPHHLGSGQVIKIKSVALVHNPNLFLEALNSEGETADDLQSDQFVAELAQILGIDAGDKAAILAKVREIADLQPEINSDYWVPRKDYELAVSRLNGFIELEEERHNQEIERTVDEVIMCGDPAFPPANRDAYIEMCRQAGGLDRFREIAVPSQERSLNRTVTADRKPPEKRTSAETNEIFSKLGLSSDRLKD